MSAIGHHSTAMTSGKLLVTSVAVIDGDDEAAIECGGQLGNVMLSEKWHLDPLSRFRMDAVAVQEFEFFGGRWNPGFSEMFVAQVDSKRTLLA